MPKSTDQRVRPILTAKFIEHVKPREVTKDTPEGPKKQKARRTRYSDGTVPNLYLTVERSGSKYFEGSYGRDKWYRLGSYPELSLDDARDEWREIRKLVQKKIDPKLHRQKEERARQEEEGVTISVIAARWLKQRKANNPFKGTYLGYALNAIKDLESKLGNTPIKEITRGGVSDILEEIAEELSPTRARHARNFGREMFEYAYEKEFVTSNPFAEVKIKRPPVKHYSHFDNKAELGEAIRKISTYDNEKLRILALLTAHLFPRKCELLEAKWSEFDFEEAEWNVPAARMKMGRLHIVPLSRQVIALLKQLHDLTGDFAHLWPNAKDSDRPMSKGTVNRVLKDLDIEVPPHGFRGTASTMLHGARENKKQLFDSNAIEAQLSHGQKNKVAASYNHADYLEARHDLMQWWSDFLDRVSSGKENPTTTAAESNVVHIHKERLA